jgi:hypothetical protein
MNLVLGYILLCKVVIVVTKSLDRTKLSDQLKVIRDGVGVTHMQVQYIFYVSLFVCLMVFNTTVSNISVFDRCCTCKFILHFILPNGRN